MYLRIVLEVLLKEPGNEALNVGSVEDKRRVRVLSNRVEMISFILFIPVGLLEIKSSALAILRIHGR